MVLYSLCASELVKINHTRPLPHTYLLVVTYASIPLGDIVVVQACHCVEYLHPVSNALRQLNCSLSTLTHILIILLLQIVKPHVIKYCVVVRPRV